MATSNLDRPQLPTTVPLLDIGRGNRDKMAEITGAALALAGDVELDGEAVSLTTRYGQGGAGSVLRQRAQRSVGGVEAPGQLAQLHHGLPRPPSGPAPAAARAGRG